MDFESAQTTEKQAGRIETRQITVSSLMNDYLDWPYLGQVFKVERRFTTLATGKVESEVQYGLTSLTRQKADPKKLLALCAASGGLKMACIIAEM
ncbi:MAG: hypothetical protein IT308_04370 [Anaerolineaceae bacterium]|nr:hypothetical protein [Anaerolineaceae bacterium]